MKRTKRRTFAVLLAAWVLAGTMSTWAWAQEAKGDLKEVQPAPEAVPLPLPALPTETPQDRKVRTKIEDTVVSFTFNEQPVMEALDFLQTLGGINILADRTKFGDPNQTVTLKLNNVPLETGLRLLTEQMGLTFIVRDGAVFISDAQGVRQPPIRLVYDVRDLVQPREFRKDEEEKLVAEALADLVRVIKETVAPGTWGGENAVSSLPRMRTIVIAHEPVVHLQVRTLITDLRRRREARRLRTQLKTLEDQMARVRAEQGITGRHPAVAGLRLKIDSLRARLALAEGPDAAPQTCTYLLQDLLVTPKEFAEKKAVPEPETRMKMLMALIKKHVAPGTWGEDSGHSIRTRKGMILVTHRPDVQQKVKEFLKVLRLDRDLLRGKTTQETTVSF